MTIKLIEGNDLEGRHWMLPPRITIDLHMA